MVLRLLAKKGLGLLGKKAKTISSVKPGKSTSSPLIKHLKESTTKVKGYDPKNPVHKEKMNKVRTDTGKDIREIEKKHGRVRYFGGGRTKLLEELGRVEAEPSNRNRRAEIARVHGELNRGYKDGGRTNLLEELGRVEAEPSNRNRRAEISRVHSELNRGYAKGGRAGFKHGKQVELPKDKQRKKIGAPKGSRYDSETGKFFIPKQQPQRGRHAEGGRIGFKKGTDKKWIQKATASIKKRGTKGKCTPITKPGCTGRAKALAKTFKKMAAKRKKS